MLSRSTPAPALAGMTRVTYCQDKPKRFLCERDEACLPTAGGYVALGDARYAVRRVERIAREALAYVMPD
ncbi:hypothetical protein KZ813_09390 [Sphingomonas sp. RHCKR7]|uniref:hypothetical protein n=1 Tax=Sphingomonas folli TaxID=2862497 RepID=UPI001CA47CC2|nr:hypothetical protein [Sphingomonas folli]MBW6527049.1 hypothetical protein [Sphingomonas folli]